MKMNDFHGFLTVVWPGQFALTKAFATWEGPSPSQVANVFVRAARPG